jgi:hypothetical protein
MSRLSARVRRLEERLGRCRLCGGKRVRIECVTPSRRYFPGETTPPGPCPACGEEADILRIRLPFEPSAPGREEEGGGR